MSDDKLSDIEAASKARQPSLFGEVLGLIKHNKKFWLIPLLLLLVILGLLIALGGTGLAPFIYTLF